MNAAYIDFEALRDEPQTLALLGILRDADGDLSFEQVVIDARLHAAVVDRPHLRRGSLEEIVTDLIDAGLPLVAWSVFDRDVVLRSRLQADVKQAWAGQFVNALAVARTWRTKVHPSSAVRRASAHDARHTLDQYARIAGYPDEKRLQHAEPAKWIRHVVAQLASRTRYRQVTREARRDWRRLLEYNRHDCYALRHVYLKAMRELDTWRAYERATYCVFDDSREICFRVGSASVRLRRLLDRYGASKWAFLTACNPASRPLQANENRARQNAMLEQLLSAGYRCLPAEGRGGDASWPAEESVLALDIPERIARRIGRQYGQLAIVAGRRASPSRLVPCL